MTHRRTRKAILALALLVSLGAAASASSVEAIKERGRLVVLSYPHPLSEFVRRTPDGGFEGLDHDLMRSFASHLGVDLEIRPVASFDRLIPELLAGRGDVVASSFSITAAREELVDFTEPYFPVLLMVVAREDSRIRGIEDLGSETACVVKGSSQEERLETLGASDRHYVPRSSDCWVAVSEGVAGYAVLDSTAVLTNLADHPTLVRAFDLPDRDEYGFAVAPGSDLRHALDGFLQKSKREGYLYRLVERHFGKQGAELFRLVRDAEP